MRTRFCYALLLFLPLLVHWPVVVTGYGTPEDFLRFNPRAAAGANLEVVHKGVLHDALLELSYAPVETVAGLRGLRLLAVGLLVFVGLAVWQLLERGGWHEIGAAVAAVGLTLLPAAQLHAGWGSAWPGLLAALLSVAGFAAVEGEWETGGQRRWVGVFGGGLLYFAAGMIYLPDALMALVPLAGIALLRPARIPLGFPRWCALHCGVLAAGVLAAWALHRWMLADAGVVDRGEVFARLEGLVLTSLPGAGTLFVAPAAGPNLPLVGALVALAVLGLAVAAARRQARDDPEAAERWWTVVAVALGYTLVAALLAINWRPGYRSSWPLAGVVLVAVVAALRGLIPTTERRAWKLYGAFAVVLGLGAMVARGQVRRVLVAPLAAEWGAMRGAVGKLTLEGRTEVYLQLAAGADTAMPEPRFGGSVWTQADAAQRMFHAAVQERYPAGLPKGESIELAAGAGAPPAGFSGQVIAGGAASGALGR